MYWLLIIYFIFLLTFAVVSWFIISTRILKFRYPGDMTKKAVLIYILSCLVIIIISFIFLANCRWDKLDFSALRREGLQIQKEIKKQK